MRKFQSTPSGGKATWSLAFSIAPGALFQSTPSGGKATECIFRFTCVDVVSIHAFRGEGDPEQQPDFSRGGVSIHAFRGEGDNRGRTYFGPLSEFQSTPSGGKATQHGSSLAG